MSAVHHRSIALAAAVLALTALPTWAQQDPPAASEPRAPARQVALLDRIVAVVNEEVVTERELEDRLSIVSRQLERQGTPLPEKGVLERQMLDRIIFEMLQLQYAKESGVKVEDVQLDRAVQRIAQDNQVGLADFRTMVERDGVSFAKFRDEIRNQITIGQLRDREVDSRVLVTDSEVDSELQRQATRPQGEAEYLAAHILVRLPEQASAEQIEARQKRANEALEALKKGADFGQISATYSDAQEALQGGNLGWRGAAKLPTLYAEALAAMKQGEVSTLLKSGNGFHIVKLLDKRGQGAQDKVTQTHVRQILVKITSTQPEGEAKNRIEQLKARLDSGSDFAELARASSDDPSAAKGGDMGWIYPGDAMPELERALETLETNQVGGPVQSPIGWHLIQVLERRIAEVSPERNRAAARLGIRQRKADEAYQDWLRQLRDRAYVENRLDEK
jgi:peptidyl-prolyl cis-trans isomerase SurA